MIGFFHLGFIMPILLGLTPKKQNPYPNSFKLTKKRPIDLGG
jgi:hypothetical protein